MAVNCVFSWLLRPQAAISLELASNIAVGLAPLWPVP